MNVLLPPELESFVREKIAKGHYQNVDEVVSTALHQMMEKDDAYQALRFEVRKGFEQLKNGESISISSREEFLETVKSIDS